MTTRKIRTHFEQVPVEVARKIAEEGAAVQQQEANTSEPLRASTKRRASRRAQSPARRKAQEPEREDW